MSDITPLDGHEFHLYVVEIVGFGVKVGISVKPDRRIETHRRDAEKFGMKIGQTWISIPHTEARANERQLIELLGGRREYLRVEFNKAVSIADSLPKSRVPRTDRERIEAERRTRVSIFWPTGTTHEDIVRHSQNLGMA